MDVESPPAPPAAKRSGGQTASPRAARQPSLAVTPQELSVLERWAKGEDRLARRARAILAFAGGETAQSAIRRSGLSENAVCNCRRRFLRARLQGIAPESICTLTPGQHLELEQLQHDEDLKVRSRASLILELARKGDLAAAARGVNVSQPTARAWRRRFLRDGVSGLTIARPRPHQSLRNRWVSADFPVSLNAEVRATRQHGSVTLQGATRSISSRHVSVALNPGPGDVLADLVGTRVLADIHWPAARGDGQGILLCVIGTCVAVECGTIHIKIEKNCFRSVPPPVVDVP